MNMGQRIKELRLAKGMTLEDLGNKVGVGKSTVRKWETGSIANMRRDKIVKIAKALDCSIAYLLGLEEKGYKTVYTSFEDSDGHIISIRDETLDVFSHKATSKPTPGLQITHTDGTVETFDVSSLVYSIMESVAEMPPEQLELVNNMVGGKKIHVVENPRNRPQSSNLPVAAHNDHADEPGEQEKMQRDIANLKKPE